MCPMCKGIELLAVFRFARSYDTSKPASSCNSNSTWKVVQITRAENLGLVMGGRDRTGRALSQVKSSILTLLVVKTKKAFLLRTKRNAFSNLLIRVTLQ